MGQIRDRLIEEMDLRGMSPATMKSYVICCRQFVAHFMKSPEQLGAVETKAFILHLIRERRSSPSAVGVYVAAIRFLYRVVLRRDDAVEDLPRPKVPNRLPLVPSREEVELL
jgi:integrase/recombinase XerD